MTAAELGLLLLRCRLSDDEWPLTQVQMRSLRQRVRAYARAGGEEAQLDRTVLRAIGCSEPEADNILALLGREARFIGRLREWQARGIGVCTRISRGYPVQLLQRLGDDAPPVLFYRGDPALLEMPSIALVGSRELGTAHAEFAAAVGRFAAKNGFVLISGNARGADRTAQEACLAHGGRVTAYVAERLIDLAPRRGVLYVSEEAPEMPFSAQRALSRNRLIHAGGAGVFVARSHIGSGGTWRGTIKNLHAGWTPVFILDDGSAAVRELVARDAHRIPMDQNYDEVLSRISATLFSRGETE